ncbi:TIGR00341 family protein [Tsuneonella mangrovi]|uniref:TIGR00341 family protein n=1 Tax=Tsuneonella mangrovi TaxID=1982042 RepID=UPI000BA26B3F|nr:TIGR00341 family protein [Tsuneonella mangrovi]
MSDPNAPVSTATNVPHHGQFSAVIHSWRHWWRTSVTSTVDQAAVIAKRREECDTSARYLFMTAMSGGIAILGLLLSSPAVVIGAMLLSPLMGPIIGLGFALAIGDYQWLRQSARSLLYGSLMAILLCTLIVFFSPIQTVTSEIASRTRPNLFDLMVALFSALAGAYAMIRGKEGTIVGVAIATALMPPLAVVGFGLATLNWTVFQGALLLFLTNLITIALTAMLMARIYGFRTELTERQTQLQNFVVVVVFIALAIPLGYSLIQIGKQANGERQVRGELQDLFDKNSRLSQVDIDWRADPVTVNATVLTPTLVPQAEQTGERALQRMLGQPVDLKIVQYKVGTGAQAAEAAQLAAAEAQRQQAEVERVGELKRALALVAGVTPADVTIDRDNRRAVVRARPLPGAGLASYQTLEKRIAASMPTWQILLQPPAGGALPTIAFSKTGEEKGQPTSEGRAALELVAWAAHRTGMNVALRGGDPGERETAAAILAGENVTPVLEPGGPEMRAVWVMGATTE